MASEAIREGESFDSRLSVGICHHTPKLVCSTCIHLRSYFNTWATIEHTKYAAVDMRVCACVYTRFTTYLAWNAYHGLAFKPNFLPNLPTFLSHLHKHLWSGNTSSCQQDMASTLPLPNRPEVFGKVIVPPLLSIYKLPVLHTRCNEPELLLQAYQQVWAVVCGFGGKKKQWSMLQDLSFQVQFKQQFLCSSLLLCSSLSIAPVASGSSNISSAVACYCVVACQLHLLPLVQATCSSLSIASVFSGSVVYYTVCCTSSSNERPNCWEAFSNKFSISLEGLKLQWKNAQTWC